MADLIRTARDGCYELRSNSWGAFLHPVDDPTANAVLEDDALKSFELKPDIARIPAELWSRWVQLCFHFAQHNCGNTEVSCRLLRHEDDKSQWRILIPVQAVDGASVRVESFDEAIDIASGEVVKQYPPAGWVPCGSSHSHNTMAAFFSGTDDKYELGDPGLHIVVGGIDLIKRKYTLASSITANKRRFLIDFNAVIDATPVAIEFHPAALSAVTFGIPRTRAAAAITKADTSLFSDPNAGNGYATRNRSGKHQQELLDEADWGWGDDIPQSDGPFATADLIDRLFNDAIGDCLMSGDNEGIDHLILSLRQLLADTDLVFSETDRLDDAPQPPRRPVAAHPTAARELPTGEW